MNQLKRFIKVNFNCDKCQREFERGVVYSLAPNLDQLKNYPHYCINCGENEEETCSFAVKDETSNQLITCDKPLFDKKKSLCRSHNRQVWKRFDEFTRDMSVSSTAGWLETWNQSGDWRYWWNLNSKKKKVAKTNTNDWNKIKKKSLGEVPQEPSQNLQAPELAPSDKRITGRTKQLNLKVKEQTYWKLKELALKNKCLMTEILEKALTCYEKHKK